MTNQKDATIVTFANRKGGVTKTTSTQNVAISLAQKGYKTLVIDLDSQGNLATVLGLKELKDEEHTVSDLFLPTYKRNASSETKINAINQSIYPTHTDNLWLAPANDFLSAVPNKIINNVGREKLLNNALSEIITDYDFILLDTSPTIDVLITNALYITDYIVIPVQTDELAYNAYSNFVDNIQDIYDQLGEDEDHIFGTIATLYQSISKSDTAVLEKLQAGTVYDTDGDALGDYPLLGTIKKTVRAKNGVPDGKAIVETEPNSDIAVTYQHVADALIGTRSL